MLEARDITFSYGKPHGKKGETSSGKAPAERLRKRPSAFSIAISVWKLHRASGWRLRRRQVSGRRRFAVCLPATNSRRKGRCWWTALRLSSSKAQVRYS